MKKLLVVLFVAFCSFLCLAQTQQSISSDGSWLEGLWEDEEGMYMIFDNGTYEYIIDDTEREVGTYILAGDSVLMTPVAYKTLIRTPEGGGFVEDVEFVGESEPKSFVVDADNRTIGELKHKEFVSPEAKEWYMDVTRDEFLKAKASVKSILKK